MTQPRAEGRSQRFLLVAALLSLAAACGEVVSAPAVPEATLVLAPQWGGARSANAVFGAAIDTVEVDVSSRSEQQLVREVVAWPSRSETIRLGIRVPLSARVETVSVSISLRDGPQYLYFANAQVELRAFDPLPDVPPMTLFYVGPGNDAVSVVMSPDTGFLSTASTQQFTATAFNSLGAVTAAPIAWSVNDTTRATITTAGLLTPRTAGPVRVRALTPNGAADSGTIQLFVPVP